MVRILEIQIRSPFPKVSCHVLKPKSVRLLLANSVNLRLRITPVPCDMVYAVASCVNAQRIAATSSILPLSLGRQSKFHIRRQFVRLQHVQIQFGDELRNFVVAQIVRREIIALANLLAPALSLGIRTCDGLPKFLSHLGLSHPERVKIDLVNRTFVRFCIRVIIRQRRINVLRACHIRTGRNLNHLKSHAFDIEDLRLYGVAFRTNIIDCEQRKRQRQK